LWQLFDPCDFSQHEGDRNVQTQPPQSAYLDVADLSRFFMEIFSFREVGVFGNGKLSWLINDEGFEIILLQEKHLVAGDQYPPGFHTGFIVPTHEDVDQLHAAIRAAGFEAPAPDMIQRGGPPAYAFYSTPPGGVTVEVSTWAE